MSQSTLRASVQQGRLIAALQSGDAQYMEQFFVYHMDFAGVATTASSTANLQIQADSAFVIRQIVSTCFDDTTHGAIGTPNTSFQLQDTGSGAVIFDAPIQLSSISGTGQLPFILPVPRVLAPSAVLIGTLKNVQSTNNQTYMVSFIGSKVFPTG